MRAQCLWPSGHVAQTPVLVLPSGSGPSLPLFSELPSHVWPEQGGRPGRAAGAGALCQGPYRGHSGPRGSSGTPEPSVATLWVIGDAPRGRLEPAACSFLFPRLGTGRGRRGQTQAPRPLPSLPAPRRGPPGPVWPTGSTNARTEEPEGGCQLGAPPRPQLSGDEDVSVARLELNADGAAAQVPLGDAHVHAAFHRPGCRTPP